jgi:hypothetical protein
MIAAYITNSKKTIAYAYGIAKEETLVKKIRERLGRLDDEQTLQLGKWVGNGNLLPDQVEIIVFLMGKPQRPELLYTEK